jgi:hypothetical protein
VAAVDVAKASGVVCMRLPHPAQPAGRRPAGASLYNGPANGDDVATSMAVSAATGTVDVTGQSDGINTGPDHATVACQGDPHPAGADAPPDDLPAITTCRR